MSRSLRRQWWSSLQSLRRRRLTRRATSVTQYSRPLRLEPLEARWLLSITVNTLADENNGIGVGGISLRDAIAAAADNETIDFAPALTAGGPASILLTHGELLVTKSLTINGPGAALLTIDATGNDSTPDTNSGDGSRLFLIDDGNFVSDKLIAISGLTLTGGDVNGSGGAILSLENLTVTNSTITGNAAANGGGGIYHAFGSLLVTGSTISNNAAVGYSAGGGILAAGGSATAVSVTSSIIDSNTGRSGGGIFSGAGDLTLTDSIVTGNSSTNRGGGIYHNGTSLSVSGGSVISNHSTYGSGGGIFNSLGPVTISNCSINLNTTGSYGGGIYIGSGSSLTLSGSSVTGNTSNRAGGGIASYANAYIVNSSVNGNTSSSYAGGIAVLRHNLTLTDSTISGNTANGSGGGVWLRNYGNTLSMTGGAISYNTSNFGSGGGIYARGGSVNLTSSTISGNSEKAGQGGGIYAASGLSLEKVVVRSNAATTNGGGIFQRYGGLSIANSQIITNTSSQGGGVYHQGYGLWTITGSVVNSNSASTSGGGIANRGGNLTISGSSITNNQAATGGGIDSRDGGSLTIVGSTINSNTASSGTGGGLSVRSVPLSMSDSTVSGNFATAGSGGGVYLFAASPLVSTIRHSTIAFNNSGSFGGGVTAVGETLELDHTIVANNSATFGPDLTNLFGVIHAKYSLIGTNAGSGLASTPSGNPDADGNLIGPVVAQAAIFVTVDVAAMGDFEAGANGDSFNFEYSVDGGPFQPLFTSSVDESASQQYFMDRGTFVSLDDPLVMSGTYLNKYFQTISAVIPDGGKSLRIRFTAKNDGPSEAFAWRNLRLTNLNTGQFVGSAVQFDTSGDSFASAATDPDYTVAGDMFGIRSRLNQGVPSLPFDIADDSISIFTSDVQGIIGQFDQGRFFGVVDTVNGVGSDTNSATWTFDNALVPLDPKLAPLADNAGPLLPDGSHLRTHALLPDSPAINAGDPTAVAGVGTVPLTDERTGIFTRVADGRIDIGAVEQQSLHLIVDTLVDENDGDFSPGDFSLREAIELANSNVGLDFISFDAALSFGTITLTQGQLNIDGSVTITGLGSQLLTVDASGNDFTPFIDDGSGTTVFNVNGSIDVTISGLTITGGDTYSGGGVRNFGNLTLQNCRITGNSAGGRGGGIYSNSGAFNLLNSEISGNNARYGSGGGIWSSGDGQISKSTITGNSAALSGGGFYTYFGNLSVADTLVSYNSAGTNGGGVGTRFGLLSISGSTIRNNNAGNNGGGIANYFGITNVSSTTIAANSAGSVGTGAGGGIWSTQTVNLDNSTVTGNSSKDNGGGVSGRSVNVVRSSISGNNANGNGGGIYASYGLAVTDSTIAFNTATRTGRSGGGIAVASLYGGSTIIDNSTITGNSAAFSGGGVDWDGNAPTLTIRHSTITNNSARFGGGVFITAGTLTLYSSIVALNTAFTTGPDITGIFGFAVDAHYSLIGLNIGTALAEAPIGSPDAKGNLIGGNNIGPIDPLLGPLADNAGPTATLALLSGSPAIDAGDPAAAAGAGDTPAHDQRGAPFTRVSGRLDIGAYERQTLSNSSFVVDTLVDENDGNYEPGDVSLREVLALARGSVGTGEEITFAPALTSMGPAVIKLVQGEVLVDDAVKITGPGATRLTIDASGNDPTPEIKNRDGSRVFNVSGGPVTIFGLTITGADFAGNGGGVYSTAALTIANSVITGNSAGSGGGAFARYANLTLTDSQVVNNNALYSGGGFWNRNATLTVLRSIITGNQVQFGGGGGIYTAGYTGNTTVTDSTVSGNSAQSGGGIYARGQLNVRTSTISGNSAISGGGIFSYTNLSNLSTTVVSSTISGNTSQNGGGIFNYRGRVDIRFSTITQNDANAASGSGLASNANTSTRTQLLSTIVSGNLHSDVDLVNGSTNSFFTGGFNLVGVGNAQNRFSVAAGDQRGVLDPKLGPLADHGGPAFTHVPLPGSPAIDTSTAGAVPGVGGIPVYDQRGGPFIRVFDGDGVGVARLDVGAVESQPIPSVVFGDFNNDGIVDSADYTVWQDLRTTPSSAADANANGIVDAADLAIWNKHFGFVVPAPGGGGGGETPAVEAAALSNIASITSESAVLALPAIQSVASPIVASATPTESLVVSSSIGSQVRRLPLISSPASSESRRVTPSHTNAAPVASVFQRDLALAGWLDSRNSAKRLHDPSEREAWVDDQSVDDGADPLCESVDAVFAALR